MARSVTAFREHLPLRRDSNATLAEKWKPKKLRWATDTDIRFIVRRLNSDEDFERQVSFLGFKLSKSRIEIVKKKLRDKAKRLRRAKNAKEEAERQKLKDALYAAIREVIPECSVCGNDSLEPEIKSKYVQGASLQGVHDHPSGYTHHTILFVYCPVDKVVHFDPGLKKIESRYNRGEFTINSPGQRFSPML